MESFESILSLEVFFLIFDLVFGFFFVFFDFSTTFLLPYV